MGAGAVPGLLTAILPEPVVVAETRTELSTCLHPAERDYIAQAVDKRCAEFTTVRGCASRALRALGHERPVQVPGRHGEPAWPRGVVGSMTHCNGYRAAAVAPAEALDAIGIDAEPNAPLPDGVAMQVASPEEARRCARLLAQYPQVRFDRLLFSIKESVYKAWFPREGVWLGFEEAEVVIDPEGTFMVSLGTGAGRARYTGAWACAGGTLVSALAVPAGRWRATPCPPLPRDREI
ncbi:MAG: 4'-phosphopantetheinyl transferase superfamily protein [Actinomyces sp.]|uniref:4'-phosphopantetheinyl transferase family protein n=1 Tax=Actinomyces sp. TaxID=29317 RepID=UPI0026DC81B3|nr:4'-phosphopantetheinyl transferase superfamily protein [Actinomyces sp.]MDO4244315.1 4'-phosphopantetheinyl transferase superfamily protein [Actinomyces sp.]